jgi:hypothetical protein
MRLWSIHPKYLDTQGLLALWREGLLAQKVLANETKGYKNHPQLQRFKLQKNPLAAIGSFLLTVQEEASRRGYHFRREKIIFAKRQTAAINISAAQLRFESLHLARKLKTRSSRDYRLFLSRRRLRTNPLFKRVPGTLLEPWERAGVVGSKPGSQPRTAV